MTVRFSMAVIRVALITGTAAIILCSSFCFKLTLFSSNSYRCVVARPSCVVKLVPVHVLNNRAYFYMDKQTTNGHTPGT